MPSPLTGLRVLDLSESIAASYCGRLLALGGAEVIKAECPSGDPVRRLGPFPEGLVRTEQGGLFAYLNAGKQGVTLDWTVASGRDLLMKLVRWADLVVEGFAPTYLPSLDLGYDVLKSCNSKLVVTSITPFGQVGPYRDYRATEIGIHAMSGEMSLAGGRRMPLMKGGNVGQMLGGLHGFLGSMAALFSGNSHHVDVSIAESLTSIIGGPLHEQSFAGGQPPARRDAPIGWPYGIRECQNGYVMVFTSYGKVWWPTFARMISDGEEGTIPPSPPSPGEDQSYWDGLLDKWLKARTREEIVSQSQDLGLAFGYVAAGPDLLSSPQLAHRHFFQNVPTAGNDSIKLPGLPFLLDGERLPFAPAPQSGEHNDAVFCDLLGLTRPELVALRTAGVV